MSDKCEFCGESLVEGECVNPECDLSNMAPAISDRADFSEDTFLPDLDLDEDFESDEALPEISSEREDGVDRLEPTLESASAPELSSESEPFQQKDIAPTIDSVPESMPDSATTMAPEIGEESAREFSKDPRGPLLSLEQAAIPIDHTGTIIFEGVQGAFHTQAELRPDQDATRLTDDENYRIIRTVLHESTESDDPKDIKTGRVKPGLTNRPEISQTIRAQDPAETHRTIDKLRSRDLSVPSDSASLEKKKARGDDYDLDSKDYTIIDKAGEGGSGVVYKAKQVALKRSVALKVLKQRRMKAGSRSRTRTKELDKRKSRFLHEVFVTAKLQHPNIIPLYDLGMNSHGEVFYSMKLIEESSAAGDEVQQSWATMVRSQPTEGGESQIEKNVGIFEKVCDAIRYAHAEQIVHRDLKPDNVMVGEFGEVLVIDWGMALDLSQGVQPFTAGGTTSYMPPEMGLHYLKQSEIHKLSHKLMVALGEARREVYVESVLDHGTRHAVEEILVDAGVSDKVRDYGEKLLLLDDEEQELAKRVNVSSDIYLLGAILYEIAVGHPPHYVPQESCKSIEEKHHREFWLSSNHRIQRLVQIKDPLRLSLCNIALKALQKDASDRYQSVDEFKEAIQGFNQQVQSLKLVETGRESMRKAEGGEGYLHLLPALESFRGAQSLWPDGEDAKKFQTQTACEYARRADARKDFDAGLSILDEYTNEETKQDKNVVTLVSKLERGKQVAARNRRLATVGWAAAVILPIGVFLASWWQTTELRTEAATARADIKSAEQEKAAAEEQAAVAKQEADEAQAAADEAQASLGTARAEANKARLEVEKAQEDKVALAAEVRKAELEIEKAETDKIALEADVKKAEEDFRQAKEEVAKAEVEVAKADAKIATAKKEVNQLKASSAEDQFKSLLLPVPMDIRRGKLEQARQRLEDLRDGDLSPQFKNGWLARHFAKVVNVKGVEHKLGENVSIIGIVHDGEESLISVAKQNATPNVWRTNSKTGETTRLEMELPDYGRIADVAISPDGKWLALALDNVADGPKFHEHFWLANLATGRRVLLSGSTENDAKANDSVIGTKLIGFGESDSGDRVKLITLEELSAYKGLKQRLQLTTRELRLDPQAIELAGINTNAISATNRGTENVQSIATMNQVNGSSAIAIVYQALDSEGRDKIVMESLVANDDGEFSSQSVDIDQYPTVMHIGSNGQLYCGYADGRVSQFSVDQLDSQPIRYVNEHESAVTVLNSSPEGEVVSGSRDGVMIVLDNQLNFIKRLVGQPDALTSVSITRLKESKGFELASGGAEGYVRVWNPSGTLHDAAIEKRRTPATDKDAAELRLGGDNPVTCGAIDRHFEAGAIPATAYGTSDGRAYYFNPMSMESGRAGQQITADEANRTRVNIAPPAATFDSAFSDFDSFGIVGDRFVLLQSDGQLFVTQIERQSKLPSAEVGFINAIGDREVAAEFQPLLASQPDLNFFFTTDPADENKMLFWKNNDNWVSQPVAIATNSKRTGRIKRLSLSPDGQWLAVVREVSRRRATGEYVTEIFEVRPENADRLLSLTSRTERYRVGDPAFVGFSADSREIVLHFHKLGVDRETWIEYWSLSDGNWKQAEAKQKIDEDRRVDLLAWDGRDLMVTKSNRRFFLVDRASDRTQEIRSAKTVGATRNRLRNVRPTGLADTQYVLFSQSLERFDGSGEKDRDATKREFENARDVRVFGGEAVVLDDNGFHLVNAKLEYQALIARREIATTSLSLSKDRLAISYDSGGLCRIMDVSVEPPAELGRFDSANNVAVSPNGQWVACQRNDELQVFDVRNEFDAPSIREDLGSEPWAFEWLGSDAPKLLVASQADDGNLKWQEINPQTGEVAESALKLPASVGVTGNLASIAVAPISQKYLSLTAIAGSTSQFALWAISTEDVPQRLGQDQGLRTANLNPLSVSFSEINQPDINRIGTRLVILSDSIETLGAQAAKSTKVFLLTDDLLPAEEDDAERGKIYRAFEVENVIDVTDGRNLIDTEFSGDGGSLLQVDDRGLKVLLSKDW